MKYRSLTYEEMQKWDVDKTYSVLIGPNGFECYLSEPEDRNWDRDGKKVVDELNRLLGEITNLKSQLGM